MRANPKSTPKRHHRAWRRRSAGLVSRRQGAAGGGRARLHSSAGRPDRPRDAGGAAARHRGVGTWGDVRQGSRSRIGLRASQRTRASSGASAGAERAARRRQLDRFHQGLAGRPPVRQRPQGQHRRSGGEERGANGGSTIGREIVRGVLGSLLGGRRRKTLYPATGFSPPHNGSPRPPALRARTGHRPASTVRRDSVALHRTGRATDRVGGYRPGHQLRRLAVARPLLN